MAGDSLGGPAPERKRKRQADRDDAVVGDGSITRKIEQLEALDVSIELLTSNVGLPTSSMRYYGSNETWTQTCLRLRPQLRKMRSQVEDELKVLTVPKGGCFWCCPAAALD